MPSRPQAAAALGTGSSLAQVLVAAGLILLLDVTGGMRSVAYSDVLQGIVLVIGSIVFLIIQRTELGGLPAAFNYWSNPANLNKQVTLNVLFGVCTVVVDIEGDMSVSDCWVTSLLPLRAGRACRPCSCCPLRRPSSRTLTLCSR